MERVLMPLWHHATADVLSMNHVTLGPASRCTMTSVQVGMQRRGKISEVVAAPGQIIMQAARYAITEALLHSISDTLRHASGN